LPRRAAQEPAILPGRAAAGATPGRAAEGTPGRVTEGASERAAEGTPERAAESVPLTSPRLVYRTELVHGHLAGAVADFATTLAGSFRIGA
jgi:hypothetical protein